nr:hypothetical protein [Tanacetum cinerariifolium]
MVVLGVNDCLRNEGIKIVTNIEKNDVNKDIRKEEDNSSNTSEFSVVNKAGKREQKREIGNGISVANKVDKMEQKREIGNGLIDISIGLM